MPAKDPKPSLAPEVKTEIESQVARGFVTNHNWRHAALDIADMFKVDFHDVEAHVRKVMHK